MTRAEDVAYAIELGVNAIGLIFYPKSPRNITLKQADALINKIPPFVDVVAVLVNPDLTTVQQIINELPIQYLQFHGEESQEFCQQFTVPYIKAVPAQNYANLQQATQLYPSASAILLDTPSATERGGTGRIFDWTIIPDTTSLPIILAGGINASNVQEAIAIAKPYAVDLCSGIEASVGIKDHQKMQEFIKVLWGEK